MYGKPSAKLGSGIKAAVGNCFASVNPTAIFTSKSRLYSLLPIKMYLPQRQVQSFMNYSAIVTVGKWVADRKGSKTKSDSMFQNKSKVNATRKQFSKSNKNTA